LGETASLVPELEALIASHPLRERLRRQLMLALYRGGRQADALRAYREARSALDDLGIEPARALRELEAAILRHDPSLDPTVRPGRRAAGVFVGREQELSQLLAGLDDAFAGRGRLFLVCGASGVGKTRLADELAARAKERGARILWGRAWKEGGEAPDYWPWRQALRGIGELPDEPDRFALFDAVVQRLRTQGAEETLLLVVDDLHAADEPSIELLGFVAGELAELHVEVIGTYDADAKLPPPLAAIVEHAAHHRVRLRDLEPDEVASFVDRVGADVEASALHAETGGNPRALWHRVRG
jgi:Bacterial transcriptional activator domain/AAA ATPase domain